MTFFTRVQKVPARSRPRRSIATATLLLFALTPLLRADESSLKDFAPPFKPPAFPRADISAMNPSQSNLGRISSDSNYGGDYYGILRLIPADASPPESFAVYELKAAKAGRYVIYAAVNLQGVPWTSPVRFSFAGGAMQPVPAANDNAPRWGASNAFAWVSLGVFNLEAGKSYPVRLESNQFRSMDRYVSFYTDGVIGFDINEPASMRLSGINMTPAPAKASESVSLEIHAANQDTVGQSVCYEVSWRGSFISNGIAVSQAAGIFAANFSLPFDVPTGDYTVKVSGISGCALAGTDHTTLHVDGRTSLPKPGRADAKIKVEWSEVGKSIRAMFDGRVATSCRFGVWYRDRAGILRAASSQRVEAGATTTTITFPDSARWKSLNDGSLNVFIESSASPGTDLAVSSNKDAAAFSKPLGCGIYVDSNGIRHHWYADDAHDLIWDGEPYRPFSGMYCDPVLTFFREGEEERRGQWAIEDKGLDTLQAAGFDDLYMNNMGRCPTWINQPVADQLNKRGIRFGVQLTRSAAAIDVYPIRSHISQGLLLGKVSEPNRLRVQLPIGFIQQLVVVGQGERPIVRVLDVNLNTGRPEAAAFIEIDKSHDQKPGQVSAIFPVRDLPPGDYRVIVRTSDFTHMLDVWTKEKEILGTVSWVRDIDWGPGLRFFLDPLANEGGVYNELESLRVWNPVFNDEFADWLKQRYGTVETMAKAWRLDPLTLESFARASRLIPLRDLDDRSLKERVAWIDPTDGWLRYTGNGPGQGWYDYIEAVRDCYATHEDKIARQIKQWVDVPIVYKRVQPWVCREYINRTVGGFNGVGAELYPSGGSMVTGGLASASAEANLGAQTLWLIGTEMGYYTDASASHGKGFPSREYLSRFMHTSAEFGLKGFCVFGWRLEPAELWGHMNLLAQPEQLKWLSSIRADLQHDWPVPAVYGQAYPEGANSWWRAGGLPLNRYTAVYEQGPSGIAESFCIPENGQDWMNSSSVPLPGADPIVVNFQSPEAVERYGPQVQQWLKDGKHIIYVGRWPSGAVLSPISDRFTTGTDDPKDRLHAYLNPKPEDEILAKSGEGRTSALLSGKLLVIGESPTASQSDHAATLPVINPDWVKRLMGQR